MISIRSTAAVLNQSPIEILDSTSAPVPVNPSTVVILNPNTAQALSPAALPAAFGHGTMVAGLVHLVAPTAKIMPLKAFKADGSSRVFDIVRAIYYAVEHGARVINMSFSTEALSPAVTRAIHYATDHGVICVSSAGNSGQVHDGLSRRPPQRAGRRLDHRRPIRRLEARSATTVTRW